MEQRQSHLDYIDDKNILKRLQEHALGQGKMLATEIRAAEILLKKSLPDLKALEIQAEIAGKVQLEWISEDTDTV